MKRTTVYLEEPIDLELARLARGQGRSKAELIREVLSKHVEKTKQKPFEVPDWVGMGRGGESRTPEEDDALLGRLIEEDHERVMAEWSAREQAVSKE